MLVEAEGENAMEVDRRDRRTVCGCHIRRLTEPLLCILMRIFIV